MINNKKLLMIVVMMVPIVVISFVFKSGEANFNLEEEKSESSENINEENKELFFRILVNGEVVNLSIDDYIIGVVAGEMPASFESEALKAQAIASRTYALYKKKANADGAYDLTDNTNNQVYLTEEAMRQKWEGDYQKYYDKIKNAVMETRDKVITYDGEIIEAFYFAMSAGVTLEAASVFNETKDYLKSVESIYDNDTLKNYEVTSNIGIDDFKTKLNLECENLVVENVNKNEKGYVNDITVCSKNFLGTDFRKLLGIRSTNFDITIGTDITIVTRGYGHGVGMSQYGANGYASNGYDYESILKHYYSGVEIKDLNEVVNNV